MLGLPFAFADFFGTWSRICTARFRANVHDLLAFLSGEMATDHLNKFAGIRPAPPDEAAEYPLAGPQPRDRTGGLAARLQ